MAQKNETPVLIVSLLVTIVLLSAGVWWLFSRFNLGDVLPTGGEPAQIGRSPNANTPVRQRLSVGQQVLLSEGASAQKQAGVEALASGNFEQAIAELEASLRNNRNDPEALIYLNNARIGDQTAYTIAVSVPARNAVSPALEILRGVAQAQDEVNQAGGINGVPLKVMIASDDNDPATSRAVADALVDDSSVLGVIGHFGSEASLAAGEVYQQGGLVMVSPTSTSAQLSDLGNYVFRTVPSDRFTAAALSRYMVNQAQQQNAAVYFNSSSDYSRSLKDEFTTAIYGDGGQVVAEFDLSTPTFDAVDSVNQAQQQDADVLVLLTNTATLDQALQVVTVNRQQLSILGGDSVYTSKTLQVGGDAAVGMVVAVPWNLQSNTQSEFVQTSRQLWGGDVNWRTAMAYDAARVLIAGLETNPTRQGVQQAIAASGFSIAGATGQIRFLPSGDRNQATQLVEVEPGSRSGYGFDFDLVQ
ncbi:ABC transporter substrate-binding protein [Oculatella sp. LEGE 06141]|uniref:ABC transporter substrate-binding protein n=1 Tax=Oculatella sp. LEGE 06141 TaxID=1828648 RepID=UPI00187F2BF6|nr:ABC transporter substrate-binding protein [Oculatella sp. LEGE 06141]MBE9178893.1 ABC transporter substrate-binding protein [Oculatella sp. LEGE 06141]